MLTSLLTPQYISVDYLWNFVRSKAARTGTPLNNPNAIPDDVIGDIIAKAESAVVQDTNNVFLFPTPQQYSDMQTEYYTTFVFLTELLTYKAAYLVSQNYFGVVGESKGSDFINYFYTEYEKMKGKLFKRLPNGLFECLNMPGLLPSPNSNMTKNFSGSFAIDVSPSTTAMGEYASGQTIDFKDSFAWGWNNWGYPY